MSRTSGGSSSGGITIGAWTTVANASMSNGWTNGTNAFAYRSYGDLVQLRGELVNAGTAGTVLILPLGFRPAQAWVQLTWDTGAVVASQLTISVLGVLAETNNTNAKVFSLDSFWFSTTA